MLPAWPMPALLCRMSTACWEAKRVSASASTAAGSVTSSVCATAVPPSVSISAATVRRLHRGDLTRRLAQSLGHVHAGSLVTHRYRALSCLVVRMSVWMA